jgi:hypothetical protein
MISPDFFIHEGLSALPMTAAYLFAGLWCYCDDTGRGRDNVTLIRAAVAPLRREFTERRIEADLAALAAGGWVCRYTVDESRLLHVPSWRDHQKPQHPTPSKLPGCPFHDGGLLEEFVSDSGVIRERFTHSAVEVSEVEGSSGVPRGAALAREALRAVGAS